MWIYVDTPQHYFIDDILDYRGFPLSVQKLLEPEDYLVFSSWSGSKPEIRHFLERNQLEPDEHVIHEQNRVAISRKDYPDAFVVRWAAQPALLDELARLLNETSASTDFCDHIIAYGRRGALLSFHDAFQSDPLIVSGCIPKSKIEEFCATLGTGFRLQDRKAFYDWSE